MLGWRSSLLLIVTKKQGWAKGRGRQKAPSAPTRLDVGKSDTGACSRVAQQPLAFSRETAGITEGSLVAWSISQALTKDRRVMGEVATECHPCVQKSQTLVCLASEYLVLMFC